MKICYIASIGDNHSRKWIRYFIERGHDVHWISLPSEHIKEVSGYKNATFYILKNYPNKFLDVFCNILKVKRLINKIKPDIIHGHYAGVNGALSALSGFHPFILTAYGSDILIAPKSKMVKPLTKLVLKRADHITCDAKHMVDAMAVLGGDRKKIEIIYFGVDTKKFSPGEKDKSFADKHGLGGSAVVISLRVLEPIYNIETFISAAAIVLKSYPNAKFVIGGTGFDEQKLKKMADDLGISSNIKFAGWIDKDIMPKYLRNSDIYVSTSLSDAGIASSTAEAMSCGLPAIITDFGDNGEWVKNGENGFLFKMKDEKELAEKIIYLLQNENERKRFGDVSRRIIEDKNNYFKEMEKVEGMYKKLFKKFN